jgi:hypothetical protein
MLDGNDIADSKTCLPQGKTRRTRTALGLAQRGRQDGSSPYVSHGVDDGLTSDGTGWTGTVHGRTWPSSFVVSTTNKLLLIGPRNKTLRLRAACVCACVLCIQTIRSTYSVQAHNYVGGTISPDAIRTGQQSQVAGRRRTRLERSNAGPRVSTGVKRHRRPTREWLAIRDVGSQSTLAWDEAIHTLSADQQAGDAVRRIGLHILRRGYRIGSQQASRKTDVYVGTGNWERGTS